MSIHILKHKLEERITGVALTESIFFRDFIDISCNQPKYFGQSIDIARNGSVVFSTTFAHRIDLDLSNVPIGENYVIDIGRGGNYEVVTSSAFSINQPFFENLVVGDQVNQGDQIIIRWDYSGNIDNYELELSSNDIVISTDKSKLSSVNFSGEIDYKKKYSYNVTKSQEFTWDVSYNDISSNREETKFYVILRDKDPSNNILVDSSANDISSAEFQIIAPVLKNLTKSPEIIRQGRDITINWDYSGNINLFQLELSNNTINYQSTNLKIQNIPNTGSNNKGSYTWQMPIDKDISGTGFKILLTPLKGGVIPIDISGIVGFIETGEFEIKFSKFFSLNVYGDDTNEKTIFEYKVISNDETQIKLDTVQGLTVGDIIEYNNRGNTFISGDTLIGGLELTTYKIHSIDAKKIKLVSSDSVNVTQDTTIALSINNSFHNTLFTKSVTSNEYLLFYKRKNKINFRISREAMSGYKFILHNVTTSGTYDMGNFGICNSVTVNPYIIEGNINWIFYEKMKLQGRTQNYDIPVENKWYITLTDLEGNTEFDISTNIFKIKYYGDCPTFPFGQFNNTKSNLKVYPFLDKGNTIQAKNPIFRSAIPLTRAQKLSYFTRNRYQNR